MTRIAIIVGSTRPGRRSRAVADWVYEVASSRDDAVFELVDIADFNLPLLDEEVPPSAGLYSYAHTQRWASKVAEFDGYLFVTPEYNHSSSAALKNAMDYLYAEWNDKVAGFVSYGSLGGTRAVEHLRAVATELQMASIRNQVALTLRGDFTDSRDVSPLPHQIRMLHETCSQLIRWCGALATLRS